MAYRFPMVLGEDTTNSGVYEGIALPLVQQMLTDCVPATLLAYGQTGSGKTYSIFGSNGELGLSHYVARSLFDFPAIQDGTAEVSLSFVEVYCEHVFDLFSPVQSDIFSNPRGGQRGLRVAEDPRTGLITVPQATRVLVSSPEDAFAIIDEALLRRRSAATEDNLRSSRSHALLFFDITGLPAPTRFALVDLAGSEGSTRMAQLQT